MGNERWEMRSKFEKAGGDCPHGFFLRLIWAI